MFLGTPRCQVLCGLSSNDVFVQLEFGAGISPLIPYHSRESMVESDFNIAFRKCPPGAFSGEEFPCVDVCPSCPYFSFSCLRFLASGLR